MLWCADRLVRCPERHYAHLVNTYCAVLTEAGHWAVEWYVDDVRQGLVWGWHATQLAAMTMVLDLARMEYLEASRPTPPAT